MMCQIYTNQLGHYFEYEVSDKMPLPNIGDTIAASDSSTGIKFCGVVVGKQFNFITGTVIINLKDVWELQ
jgi:hypothetical protein